MPGVLGCRNWSPSVDLSTRPKQNAPLAWGARCTRSAYGHCSRAVISCFISSDASYVAIHFRHALAAFLILA